jgi:hypothetical protein
MTPTCYLARFSDRPCDGRLISAHLVPRKLLRRQFPKGTTVQRDGEEIFVSLAEMVLDQRTWVWACGGIMGNSGHHGMLDTSRTLRVPRWALPAGLEAFAAEVGVEWWVEREYGPHEPESA